MIASVGTALSQVTYTLPNKFGGDCSVAVIGGKLCAGWVAEGEWVTMKGADA